MPTPAPRLGERWHLGAPLNVACRLTPVVGWNSTACFVVDSATQPCEDPTNPFVHNLQPQFDAVSDRWYVTYNHCPVFITRVSDVVFPFADVDPNDHSTRIHVYRQHKISISCHQYVHRVLVHLPPLHIWRGSRLNNINAIDGDTFQLPDGHVINWYGRPPGARRDTVCVGMMFDQDGDFIPGRHDPRWLGVARRWRDYDYALAMGKRIVEAAITATREEAA